MSNQLESHFRSCVCPCGTYKHFALYIESGMDHRELLAMWRQLEKISQAYVQTLKIIVDQQDATNYVI